VDCRARSLIHSKKAAFTCHDLFVIYALKMEIDPRQSNVDKIVASILGCVTGELTLVAVDGLAASGKTRLTDELARRNPTWQLIRLDELQCPTPSQAWAHWTDEECSRCFVDTNQLRSLLTGLRQGLPVDFRPYDWMSHRVSEEERTYLPEGVVLVEGIYTMRDVLLPLYDLTVWVELDHEERMRRIGVRPPAEPGWQDAWFRGESAYMSSEKPQHRATMVVSGAML